MSYDIDSLLEVRFKNSGLDAVEIQDNGNGIAPEDFESVGMSNSDLFRKISG
jgi:DNA mismatch repair ATPase MutL